ncbi:enoyl-CoA hydratase/isomerase family protein [Janibacter sp. YIM B02568]|uniref:enoyl-CoA hydratase/isomerase family protein n=1 Tax=Janibacter endophyticus TaxID=2806261 RepID=UPI001951AC96|nr:enoyl-CoA hydratase/isomerase family protein [Janibacter endophyticus]MBM6544650.1 enoyl-CoA hydratase/isomerase family protein [Janibacter endophyticus]
MTEPTVLAEVRGSLGLLTLNRPRAINALDVSMMEALPEALEAWRHDDRVRAVAMVGAGERGFCAGGDVRAVRQAHLDGGDGTRFFRMEYAVDLAVAEYDKPVVAVMDGITMGGGVGLGMNADLRIVTERTQMAMPETIIGFFPDVGATYRLSRSPGELGTHVALTGMTFGAGDAVALGLADTLVESSGVGDVLDGLAKGDAPSASVGRVDPPSGLAAARAWIDECYAGDDPVAIVERLETSSSPEARAAAATIRSRSPLAVAITLEALRRALTAGSLSEVLETDGVIASRMLDGSDFAEGVRAQLVDKDRDPTWRHARIEDVTRDEVLAFFP